MKDENLTFGIHRVGIFLIGLRPCVFDERSATNVDFFEVMVAESIGKNLPNYYVHLIEDERFLWFSWMAKFGRPLRTEEVIEYNSYIQRKAVLMPTWKLSRMSVRNLFDMSLKIKRK